MIKTRWSDFENRWRNLFPANPTQTSYLRFLKGPEAGLKTRFTESQKEVGQWIGMKGTKSGRDWTKTAYLPDGVDKIGGREK